MYNKFLAMRYSEIEQQKIIRLRISGGRIIETFAHVLCKDQKSLFAELAKNQSYIDCGHRDGRLIRLLVDSMRQYTKKEEKPFIAPENFDEWRQLIVEAKYWRLNDLEQLFRNASSLANTITVAYHGTLTVGKQGHTGTDINFRRINRILVSGKAWACREVFGKHLNETRDGNTDTNRYTSRFYLIHTFLEQAFDTLAAHGYKLVTSSNNNPNLSNNIPKNKQNQNKLNDNENKFLYYCQFVFVKTN